MYIKDIYETVTMTEPCPQPKFLSYLDTTIRSLIAKYGIRRVINDEAYIKPRDINGDIAVKEEFAGAVASNILYLITKNPDHKTNYVAEAEYAYLTIWREAMRGKKIVGSDYLRK